MVEDLPKKIELLLLEPQPQSCRPSCLFLESSMHPFMTSVLLRTPRLNPFVNNSHLHPPKRKLRQAKQARPGEWRGMLRDHRGEGAKNHEVERTLQDRDRHVLHLVFK